MPSLRAACFGLLSGAIFSIPAFGQNAYVADNPPYSIQSGDRVGFGVELVNEMAKLLKANVSYTYMPWGEAQTKVLAGQDLLIFPFSRTPEREQKYGWLQKLFEVNAMFFSGPGSQAVQSIEQAKALPSIGVNAGSAWEKDLAKRGFSNIKPYPTNLDIVAALVSGEIQAAYGPDIEVKYAWRVGHYKGALVAGAQVQKGDQYLAMSKSSPSIKQEDWQEAFSAIQQDGTFDRIYDSYFGGK
jgi:ABC-type amino acid transport substrate-binding protein